MSQFRFSAEKKALLASGSIYRNVYVGDDVENNCHVTLGSHSLILYFLHIQ